MNNIALICALALAITNLAFNIMILIKITNLGDYEEIHVETNRRLLEIDSEIDRTVHDFTKNELELMKQLITENQEFKISVLDCIKKDHDTTMDLHKNLLNLVGMDHDNHVTFMKSLNSLVEDSVKVNDERWNLICDYITNDKEKPT